MNYQWDDEADVVIVGYGGAGAAAAVSAADLGASVLILEKQAQDRHTPSTGMTSGVIIRVNNVEKATTYFDRCSGGLIPHAVSRAWAERAINVMEWLRETCSELEMRRLPEPHAQHPDFEGAESIEVFRGPGIGDFFAALKAAVARRPRIKVLWRSPGRRLIRNDDGRVVGVEVTRNGGTQRIGASKGVILTCGGYEYDEEMKKNYLRAYPAYFYGNPGNTGDGVRMAQAVGADLWHMNLMIGRAIGHFELDDGTPLNFLVDIKPPGYVITDRYGRRFADESEQANMIQHLFLFDLLDYDVAHREYSRIPCYWFFDQRRIKAGSVTSSGSGKLAYSWSQDNEKEIARGWIKRAETIEEVAALAGIADPEMAARSVDDYNQGCRNGRDVWGRNADSLVPLDQPPFYCVPLYPGGPATCGGPRRNEHAQIVDTLGEPIPGLFGAGELGEPLGLLYPHHGSNLCECLCFGQIAAETAVRGVGRRAGVS